MFELLDPGLPTQRELEIRAEDIDISGLVAHIDMFAVEAPPSSSKYSPQSSHSQSPTHNDDGHHIILPQDSSTQLEGGSAPPNIGSTCTNAVFGSSFVHGVQMDWRGESVVFFVFSDLSVRFEGYFCMRYRCFDLFSRTAGSDDVPITAELYSGTFVIYSTKE
jgi:hypothetical protein